jgi:serine-type D-Ala-D-Ala carboxypeptidase (penicillin-binding protein 5/6)
VHPHQDSAGYHGAGHRPHMRSQRPTQRRSTRLRRALAAVLGTVFLVIVVVANQPSAVKLAPASTHTPSTGARQLGRTESQPTPTAAMVLQLLHRHIAFSDDSAAHTGAPSIAADTGILVDIDTGTILWERDPHLAHAPASTTKVLSSLVALQNFAADRMITITPDALQQAGDETKMGLVSGNRMTVQELLEGMLLVSGNDAADAMAIDTVGMDPFVDAMNRQLEALGLHDSHFVTPVGLDDPAQKASAYDLAVVATADVTTFPLFRQIVSQTEITLPASPDHQEFDLGNLNRLLRLYPAATGIKPGWTGDAGGCLIGMAERNGHRLISVLMNSSRIYTDSRDLLDWGFVQEGLPSLLPPPSPTRP